MFDLTKNYNISRRLAAQGMILLKNEDRTLPLRRSDKIGIVGEACLDLIKGGGGSSCVKCEYEKSLLKGLEEKTKSGKIDFFDDLVYT